MTAPRSNLPRSTGSRGLAGKIPSVARRLRPEQVRPPARRTVAPPPPPPPPVERPPGVASLMPRPEIPLPPKRHFEPHPPAVRRPKGLAGRIPPLARRTFLARPRSG